jgi:hypothetical protein
MRLPSITATRFGGSSLGNIRSLHGEGEFQNAIGGAQEAVCDLFALDARKRIPVMAALFAPALCHPVLRTGRIATQEGWLCASETAFSTAHLAPLRS